VFRKRAEEYYQKALRLQEQATNFTASDQFVPHDLAESSVKELQAQLAKVYGLAAAYLFRKIIDGAEEPLYVLAVLASYTWKDGVSGKHIDPLFEDLSAKVQLPSPVSLLSLDGLRVPEGSHQPDTRSTPLCNGGSWRRHASLVFGKFQTCDHDLGVVREAKSVDAVSRFQLA
jgi:hypothetical protein